MTTTTITLGDTNDPRVVRALGRFLAAARLGESLADAMGMSDQAFARLVEVLDHLATLDPEQLHRTSGDRDAFARRTIRLIAGCLLRDTDEWELAARVAGMLGNPRLLPSDVKRILFDRAADGSVGEALNAELSVWDYRKIAENIRAGMPVREAATSLGINHKRGEMVSTFLGYAQYRKDVMIERAWNSICRDVPIKLFAQRESIAYGTARDYYTYARKVFGAFDPELDGED